MSGDLATSDTRAPEGYRTQSADTSYAIERRLVDAWQRMSSSDKARLLVDGCEAVTRLSVAGLRLRHPHASERELWLRAAAVRLGPELMRDVYGWDLDQPAV